MACQKVGLMARKLAVDSAAWLESILAEQWDEKKVGMMVVS